VSQPKIANNHLKHIFLGFKVIQGHRCFPYPISFNALDRGDPLRISGKALRILKLESFAQLTVNIAWS